MAAALASADAKSNRLLFHHYLGFPGVSSHISAPQHFWKAAAPSGQLAQAPAHTHAPPQPFFHRVEPLSEQEP